MKIREFFETPRLGDITTLFNLIVLYHLYSQQAYALMATLAVIVIGLNRTTERMSEKLSKEAHEIIEFQHDAIVTFDAVFKQLKDKGATKDEREITDTRRSQENCTRQHHDKA